MVTRISVCFKLAGPLKQSSINNTLILAISITADLMHVSFSDHTSIPSNCEVT